MEAEERPSKIRKINGEPNGEIVHDEGQNPADEKSALQEAAASPQGELNVTSIQPKKSPAKDADVPNDASLPAPQRLNLPASHPLAQLATQNPTLSKNQLKKLLRNQRWEDARPERKAKRKVQTAAKKERKRAERDAYLASAGISLGQRATDLGRQAIERRGVMLPISFLVDCSFDELMKDGERVSLASQITRMYSDNRRAKYKGRLVVCSFVGKLRERFDGPLSGNWRNWKGFGCDEKRVAEVVDRVKAEMGKDGRLVGPFAKYTTDGSRVSDKAEAVGGGVVVAEDDLRHSMPLNKDGGAATTDEQVSNGAKATCSTVRRKDGPTEALLAQGETVYLTSESPNTLTELKPYSTYIIGGLVDKNREKGICYKRACEAGIKTARLPIGDFLEMSSRKVLATNHVLEIMLKWLEHEDWGKAFVEVIPARKKGTLKSDKAINKGHGGIDPEEQSDEDSTSAISDLHDEEDRGVDGIPAATEGP